MTKKKHQATNPTAYEIMRWNENNEDKYTKAEYQTVNPDVYEIVWWNRYNKRSEEHTSELQSHSFISYAVFCLKKKNNPIYHMLQHNQL